jgi:hypothetical protein
MLLSLNTSLSISKMDSDYSDVLRNIASSMDQLPPSSCSTEQMLNNIRNTARVPTSPVYISSPSDVSLWDEDPQQKKPHQHLQQFLQLVNQHETSGTSLDNFEYRPPLSAVEEDLGLALQLERGDEMDIKGKLG